jgi:hypothetical protein
MDGLDLLGWVGNCGFIMGVTLLGQKYSFGFVACFTGNVCYALQAFYMLNIPLFFLSVILATLNLVAFAQWRRS